LKIPHLKINILHIHKFQIKKFQNKQNIKYFRDEDTDHISSGFNIDFHKSEKAFRKLIFPIFNFFLIEYFVNISRV
jgi:hypothetical protein